MTQAKNGSTVVMNYVYNGMGERVRKYLNTANTYTLYADAGRWLGDYGNAGAPNQQVIWFDDLPVGVLDGAGANQKLHYIEPDALGTPRVVIDRTRGAQGVAIWRWDLTGEAFGTTAPNENPDGDATAFVFDMRFPGQRYDAASGLNYNYFRDYEPGTGRHSQSDPIGLAGGVNTYGYVGGSPTKDIDAFGLTPLVCRKGDKVVIIHPVSFEIEPGITREAATRAFREAERVWTGSFGRYDVHLHITDGRRIPNTPHIRIHHYQPWTGDGTNFNSRNWHIPNPADGRYWTNFDWSIIAHEIGHDILGFPGNMEPPGTRTSVMGRRTGSGPSFSVSEFDIDLLLDRRFGVNHADWEKCECSQRH